MKILKTTKKEDTVYNLSSSEKKKIIKKAVIEANKEQLEVVKKYYEEFNVAS